MDPIYNRSEVVQPILVGSLGAISTLVLARLAQLKWNHCLFLAGTAGLASGKVYQWWKFPYLSIEEWIQSKSSIYERLETPQDATTKPLLRQSARRWLEDYLSPYEKSLSEEKKAELKSLALQRIAQDPKEAVILLWLSRGLPGLPAFFTSLFEEKEKIPSSFVDFLREGVFQKEIAEEKVVESWKLLIALYNKQSTELEEAVKSLGPFSFEEKGIILDATFRITIQKYDKVDTNNLSAWMPPSMQEGVGACILRRQTPASFTQKTIESVFPHLNIPQLVKFIEIDENLNPLSLLKLQKKASDSSKVIFSIEAFSVQESSCFAEKGPFGEVPLEAVICILKFTPISTHLQWCCVSKACCEIGKLQSYWQVRLGADFEKSVAADLSSTTPWSDAYRKSHYLYRQIPAQFKSITPQTPRTRVCAFFALDKQQLSYFLDNGPSEEENQRASDNGELEIDLLMKVEKLKVNQENILNFFQKCLFESWKEGKHTFGEYDPEDYVSRLCVDEASVPQILKWACEASVLSKKEAEVKQENFLVVVAKVHLGLLERFGWERLKQLQLSQEQTELYEKLINEFSKKRGSGRPWTGDLGPYDPYWE